MFAIKVTLTTKSDIRLFSSSYSSAKGQAKENHYSVFWTN